MSSFLIQEVLATVKPDRKALLTSKIVSMITLSLAALVCSVLPLLLARRFLKGGLGKKSEKVLGYLLRLGGGILLATTFLHLLPEVNEGVEALDKAGAIDADKWPLPIAELVMCIGFFVMYLIEELAHVCLHSDSHTKDSHSHNTFNNKPIYGQQHSDEANNGGHSHTVSEEAPSLRGILIIIAVSVHQIFEGLAVGLQDNPSDVWVLLGAIAAHKCVIALCVGMEMATSKTSTGTATICVAAFALATPIGIGTGIGLSSAADKENVTLNITSIILQGMATGTLLYVVFFEVLSKTEDIGLSLMHLIFTVAGFIIMMVLLVFFRS